MGIATFGSIRTAQSPEVGSAGLKCCGPSRMQASITKLEQASILYTYNYAKRHALSSNIPLPTIQSTCACSRTGPWPDLFDLAIQRPSSKQLCSSIKLLLQCMGLYFSDHAYSLKKSMTIYVSVVRWRFYVLTVDRCGYTSDLFFFFFCECLLFQRIQVSLAQ
jgi:hypothetical protein